MSDQDANRIQDWLQQGQAALEAAQPSQALVAFDRMLASDQHHPAALQGRAQALRLQGRLREAVDAFDRALEADAGMAAAFAERAECRRELDQNDLALADYRQALHIDPTRPDWHIACALLIAGSDTPAALAHLRQAATLGADAAQVEFLQAAMTGAAPPPSSPPQYVSELFDAYAPRFERDLMRRLHYRAPQLLADLLLPTLENAPAACVVDLGCGTGLMGRLLRDYAARLDGVDLSPGMLAQARAIGIYDDLQPGDLVDYLRRHPSAYDVAVAADVFVYIGDLAPVFAALRLALRGEGMVAFTVEALDEGEFILQATRRYAHSRTYLERMARAHGFGPHAIQRRVLRRNGGADVSGYVALFARRAERR